MADAAPSCRLQVILAAASRRAVIFRRGPAKQTRLIAWDRDTDTFEPGQWVRRTRVYAERSDLSPDGAFLLTFMGRFRPPIRAYTVLSRPPYFTALALWPSIGTWSHGGVFLGSRAFVLLQEAELAPGFNHPEGFTIEPRGPSTDARLAAVRQRTNWRTLPPDADGWTQAKAGAKAGAKAAGGVDLLVRPPPRRLFWEAPTFALRAGGREAAVLPGVQWADFDGNGDLLFAVGGALHRCPSAAVASHDAVGAGRCLADFAGMRFEPVAAPYPGGQQPAGDPAAPSEGGFAPHLDRVTREDRRQRGRLRKALRAAAGRRDG